MILLSVTSCGLDCDANVYYVDYSSGLDTNDGTSPARPWKHAPGDKEAVAIARSAKLAAGDKVLFRGGVRYHGTVTITADGAENAPITYSGNEWGAEPAIFDSGRPARSITRCASAADCGDAPNWGNLSVVSFDPPAGPVRLFDAQGGLYEGQYPRPKDPFFADDIQDYVVTAPALAASIATGSLATGELAKQLGPTPGQAAIAIWVQGNEIVRRQISAVEGDTLHFDASNVRPYTNRPGRVALVNVPRFVEEPGLYATLGPGRAVAWLRQGQSTVYIGGPASGFDINGRSNVAIKGFVFEHYVAAKRGERAQITNTGGIAKRISIAENTFRNSAILSGGGSIMIGKIEGLSISNNTFTNIGSGSGIRVNSRPNYDFNISNNTFRKIGRTGILLMSTRSAKIEDNSIYDLNGIHGNGISVYLDNQDVQVSRNLSIKTTRPLTFHGDKRNPGARNDITINNNTFIAEGRDSSAAVTSFGNTVGVRITDNFLYGPKAGILAAGSDKDVVIENNRLNGIIVKGDEPAEWSASLSRNKTITASDAKSELKSVASH